MPLLIDAATFRMPPLLIHVCRYAADDKNAAAAFRFSDAFFTIITFALMMLSNTMRAITMLFRRLRLSLITFALPLPMLRLRRRYDFALPSMPPLRATL